MFGEEVRLEVSSSSLGPRSKIDIVVGCESSRRDDADLQINVEEDTVIGMSDVSLGETKSCHTRFAKGTPPTDCTSGQPSREIDLLAVNCQPVLVLLSAAHFKKIWPLFALFQQQTPAYDHLYAMLVYYDRTCGGASS